MKISYLLQLKDFFIMFLFGIIIATIYNLLNICNYVKIRMFNQIIVDIIIFVIGTLTFIILINKINMGDIRLFLLIGYLLGIIIEQITLGKLFAKIIKKVYNKIHNWVNLLKNNKIIKGLLK